MKITLCGINKIKKFIINRPHASVYEDDLRIECGTIIDMTLVMKGNVK